MCRGVELGRSMKEVLGDKLGGGQELGHGRQAHCRPGLDQQHPASKGEGERGPWLLVGGGPCWADPCNP